MSKFDLYETITNRIIEKLNQGIIPWKKSWSNETIPVNHLTNKPYRGVNVFLLPDTYKQSRWLTFKQCQQLKGSVKPGEKASIVVYWTLFDVEDEKTHEIKKIPFLKYYSVFNVAQTTLEYTPTETNNNQEIVPCQDIVNNYADCPKIKNGNSASYSPSLDEITIPELNDFSNSDSYYATLFHELVHSTGSKKRLDRTLSVSFGSEPYAKEELIAEMGSAFLCGKCEILPKTEENTIAYIQSWIKALQNDKKMVVSAAGAAQKAVEYIITGKVNNDVEK